MSTPNIREKDSFNIIILLLYGRRKGAFFKMYYGANIILMPGSETVAREKKNHRIISPMKMNQIKKHNKG